jgi:peptidoglycan/xylan/chitin deacetylase (PgdA/CDA1 family)
MGHNQSNARYLHLMSREDERRVVLSTFDRIEKATGRRPTGWLSSGLQESWHTLDYLVEAGATYVADWINDGVWRATGSEIVDHYLASGQTF